MQVLEFVHGIVFFEAIPCSSLAPVHPPTSPVVTMVKAAACPSKAAASARLCRGAAKRRQPTETDDPESLERARRERLVQKAIQSLHDRHVQSLHDRQTLLSANVPKKVPETEHTDKEAHKHDKND